MSDDSVRSLDTIGLLCTILVSFWIFKFIFSVLYNNFLAPTFGINAVNLKETGKWAVITGATDGIGKAYAEALAKRKFNIVLISRNQTKLDDVAEQLHGKFNVELKTIAADFCCNTNINNDDIYYKIDKQLMGLDIGILINNVGMSYPYPEYFLDLKNSDQIYENILKCNIISVINMCKIVLPGMIERKRGVIVNISSSSAQIPSPLLTVYAASKAFVDKFSEDLAAEYNRHQITIQCLLPGYVATNMSKIKSSTWMAPSPAKYVEEAISTIGIREKTTGYYPHSLLVGILHFLDSISPQLSRWLIVRTMTNIRARALRRQIQ